MADTTKSEVDSLSSTLDLVGGDSLDIIELHSLSDKSWSSQKGEEAADGRSSALMETSAATEPVEELTELQKYWQVVKENASDFNGWTYLLQYVEQEATIEDAREAFDAFLARYPYCYGYWKKYADLEKKNCNISRCRQAFERGVEAIPQSVDLWVHFMSFIEEQRLEKGQTRSLYERAVAACGLDFKSHKIWEQYIDYETRNKNVQQATNLYDRILAIPCQTFDTHIERFRKLVEQSLPKDILSVDEFMKLRKEVVNSAAITDEDADTAPPGLEDTQEAPPGLDGQEPAGKLDEKEMAAMREKIMSSREPTIRRTHEEVARRWHFEESIKRPYFHVKPLEKAQLKTWKDYLDFEIEIGSQERILFLFERCLISCALYEEFWLKYALYLEKNHPDLVKSVYERACTIHLQKKPTIHLAWAAYEEQQGNYDAARSLLVVFNKRVPGLVSVALRRAGLERRTGNFAQVEQLFNEIIQQTKPPASCFLAVKYARYLAKVVNNLEKAKSVLREAVDKDPKNPRLYMQLLELECQQDVLDDPHVLGVFEEAIRSCEDDDKITLSLRRIDFLEEFGSNVIRLREAHECHRALLKTRCEKNKRKPSADDTALAQQAGPAEKKTKTEVNQNGDGSNNYASSTQGYPYQNWSTTAQHYPGYAYGQAWPGYSQSYYGQYSTQ